jgi:predicted PurR-regulated permease PerM
MTNQFHEHLRTTGVALRRWLLAQTYDALSVTVLWLAGLLIIGVPLAPVWAVLGGILQFIPHLGPVLALIGPAITAAISGGGTQFLYVLVLYAVIVVVEGLVLQPIFMKRTARVPLWASILAPIVLGLIFSFWGVVIAAPLLAIIYAFREKAHWHAPPGT